jgi:NADP-dependent 3-hydroxy acid dehydrogenase YdfG
VTQMDDRVVFLTGAAEGLGSEVARELAKAGKRLALFDVQAEKLQAVADELASVTEVLPLAVDLADATATQQAVDKAIEHYGTPRALIHNAAVLKEVALIDVTLRTGGARSTSSFRPRSFCRRPCGPGWSRHARGASCTFPRARRSAAS